MISDDPSIPEVHTLRRAACEARVDRREDPIEEEAIRCFGQSLAVLSVVTLHEINLEGLPLLGVVDQAVQRDEAGSIEVVHVVDGVGDVIGPVHQVCLERARHPLHSLPDPLEVLAVPVVGSPLFGVLRRLIGVLPGVLEHAIESPAREVQAGNVGRTQREPGDDAKRLRVPLRRAPLPFACRTFSARCPEGRVAEVVSERGRLGGVLVKRIHELPGDRSQIILAALDLRTSSPALSQPAQP